MSKVGEDKTEYIPNNANAYVRGMMDALKLVLKEQSCANLRIGGKDD